MPRPVRLEEGAGVGLDNPVTPEELAWDAMVRGSGLNLGNAAIGEMQQQLHIYPIDDNWLRHPRHDNWFNLAAAGYWFYRNEGRSDLARKFLRRLMISRHSKAVGLESFKDEMARVYHLARERVDKTMKIKKEPTWAGLNYADFNEALLPKNEYEFNWPLKKIHIHSAWVEQMLQLNHYIYNMLYQGKKYPQPFWDAVGKFMGSVVNLTQEEQDTQLGDPNKVQEGDYREFPFEIYNETKAKEWVKILKKYQGSTFEEATPGPHADLQVPAWLPTL